MFSPFNTAGESGRVSARSDYDVALVQPDPHAGAMLLFAMEWSSSAGLLLGYAVPTTIIALLIVTTVLGRDLWPFSHYPMFAGQPGGDTVRYFRLRFEMPDGKLQPLHGHGQTLADAFHTEVERLSGERLRPEEKLDAIALKYWQQAIRLDPRLKAARGIEITLCLARWVRGDEVVFGEQKLVSVPVPTVV